MRKLLDYTRTGRWQTIEAAPVPQQTPDDSPPARQTVAGAGQPGSAIRRLLDFTGTGRWLTLTAGAGVTTSLGADEAQALFEDTFFGLDVEEIPSEKWPEIAPLFPR